MSDYSSDDYFSEGIGSDVDDEAVDAFIYDNRLPMSPVLRKIVKSGKFTMTEEGLVLDSSTEEDTEIESEEEIEEIEEEESEEESEEQSEDDTENEAEIIEFVFTSDSETEEEEYEYN